ncbi:hypothetical protein BKA65DRAFT_564113 [Rhexocercosporidium sp. MPI-PUGE-AT-0058]|nr:hypothetical protein BKA65DRAFT_564113 [Rhexocercosporidium sp. MPI-PUGE-AT-0058]
MSNGSQQTQERSLKRPAPPSPFHNAFAAQRTFSAYYNTSTTYHHHHRNIAMSAQSNQASPYGMPMPHSSLEPPRAPNYSCLTTPALPQSFTAPDRPASGPNQPPSPQYKSPYSHKAPVTPLGGNQAMAAAPNYSRNIPSTYNQTRSLTPAPMAPTISHQALRASEAERSTAGYIAYSNELRKAAARNKVRSNRLSPVSHVRNTLNIVADTVCMPSIDTRLAGVMAGNPMINSVKVIKNLAEFNEELADQIDDRDAYIRQLHASQVEIQDSHNQAIKEAVDAAVRDTMRDTVRPLPKPTEEQAAELKERDDRILALEEFIKDQAERILRLETSRDLAQDQLEQARRSSPQNIDFDQGEGYNQFLAQDQDEGHCQHEGYGHVVQHGHDQDHNQAQSYDQSPGDGHQSYGHNEGYGRDQGHDQIMCYDQNEGHGHGQPQNFAQGDLQNFDLNQDFDANVQTFGQTSEFSQYPDLDQVFTQNLNYFRGLPQNEQEQQQGLRGQQVMGSQQGMASPQSFGGQHGILLQQGIEGQLGFVSQKMRNLQGMEDPFVTPRQQDASVLQAIHAQQSPQLFHSMQDQHNPSTPNRRQRSASQQSPQGARMQGQRHSSTPNRPQKKQKVVEEEAKVSLAIFRDNLRRQQMQKMQKMQGGRYEDGFKRTF